MLKNTSFESYGIVLFKIKAQKCAKMHSEAVVLRKCYMALVKCRFFWLFPTTMVRFPPQDDRLGYLLFWDNFRRNTWKCQSKQAEKACKSTVTKNEGVRNCFERPFKMLAPKMQNQAMSRLARNVAKKRRFFALKSESLPNTPIIEPDPSQKTFFEFPKCRFCTLYLFTTGCARENGRSQQCRKWFLFSIVSWTSYQWISFPWNHLFVSLLVSISRGERVGKPWPLSSAVICQWVSRTCVVQLEIIV